MTKNMKVAALSIAVFLSFLVLSSSSVAVEAPEPRSRSEIEAVLAKAPGAPARRKLRRLNVILVADKKDHGVNEHDYPLWQKRWQLLLGGERAGKSSETQVNLYGPAPEGSQKEIRAGAPKVNLTTAWQWPSKEQLESADLVVMFCYGKWNEQKLKDLEGFLARGGGFVAIHPAVIPDKAPSQAVARLIGLAWENDYTGWRHGPMDLKIAADRDPICLGLPKTIHLLDEAYWPFRGDLKKVTVLATSNEKVKKDSDESRPEPMFWTYQHGKGRVMGCVLGHYNWTFDDPYVRILLLRGMAWASGESPYRFDRLVLRGAAVK